MRCDYCDSTRGVEEYPNFPDGVTQKCQVCSRLRGTDNYISVSLSDINQNIVTLFHTLGLTPHDTDEEALLRRTPMTLRQRIRFAWHVISDRHWPVLIDDLGYRCSCGVALLFEEDTE